MYTTCSPSMATAAAGYDRQHELKAFDDTKAGVKGLVDAGVMTIPAIFLHPPESLTPSSGLANHVPVIDLDAVGTNEARRLEVVGKVKAAAAAVGFFQVVNHGVQETALAEILAATRQFNEEPAEAKKAYYTRDVGKNVRYNSNFDLFEAPAANWRDSLFCEMAPRAPAPEKIPPACRDITFEYAKLIQKLGITLFELLSEALGLDRGYLKEIGCVDGLNIGSHYYPACPEPHLTLGTTKHSDPSFLTVLLQDDIGGLQVLHQNQWIDVPPVPGALIINIGDLLQLLSNDKFKSVEHRVVAKSIGPRVSVACFFSTCMSASTRLSGPIKELTSDASPPLYRNVTDKEFITYYNKKGLDGRSALDYFRL